MKKKEEVVEQAILKYYKDMYRLALSYVKNQHDALDIVQESVYKSIKNAKQLKKEEFIKTWLFKIVINTSLAYIKKNPDWEPIEDHQVHTVTESVEMGEHVKELLDTLKEKERMIIILHYFQGFTLEEIGEMLEMNQNTVKTVMYRSLKKMKMEDIAKGE